MIAWKTSRVSFYKSVLKSIGPGSSQSDEQCCHASFWNFQFVREKIKNTMSRKKTEHSLEQVIQRGLALPLICFIHLKHTYIYIRPVGNSGARTDYYGRCHFKQKQNHTPSTYSRKKIPSGLLRTLQLGPLHRSNYKPWNLVTTINTILCTLLSKKHNQALGDENFND